MRAFSVVSLASLVACAPTRVAPSIPAAPEPVPTVTAPAAPPRPSQASPPPPLAKPIDLNGLAGRLDFSTSPTKAAEAPADARMAHARQEGELALKEAKLDTLELGEQAPQPTFDGGWRFALWEPGACEGACKQFSGGEQVGWLIVALDEGRVTVEALEQEWSVAAYRSIRAREKRWAKRMSSMPPLAAYCRLVVDEGADACTMWLERAPAPDCTTQCRWQAYVGSATVPGMSMRELTLLIDDRTGALSVRQLDGTVVPMARYRRGRGF